MKNQTTYLQASALLLLSSFALNTAFGQDGQGQKAPKKAAVKKTASKDEICNVNMGGLGLGGVLKNSAEQKARAQVEATDYAKVIVQKIIAATENPESEMVIMAQLNKELIEELSMDAGNLNKLIDDKTVASIGHLQQVQQLSGSLTEQLSQFKRELVTLLPQIQDEASKRAEKYVWFNPAHIVKYGFGEKAKEKKRNEAEKATTVRTMVTTMQAGIDELYKMTDLIRDEVPQINAATEKKNAKATMISTALEQIEAEWKQILVDNAAELSNEERLKYEAWITGISDLILIAEKVRQSNNRRIAELSAIYYQTMSAAQFLRTEGQLALGEISQSLVTLEASGLATKLADATKKLVKLSDLANEKVLKSLQDNKNALSALENDIRARTAKLASDQKTLVAITNDAIAGRKRRLELNEQQIQQLRQISKEYEQAEEIQKAQRQVSGK